MPVEPEDPEKLISFYSVRLDDQEIERVRSGLGLDSLEIPGGPQVLGHLEALERGMWTEAFEKELANAKEEYRTGVPPKGAGSDAAEWAGVVNYGLLAGLFAALLWSINHDYNNAFTKWFVVHFPDEARTMGIEFPVD